MLYGGQQKEQGWELWLPRALPELHLSCDLAGQQHSDSVDTADHQKCVVSAHCAFEEDIDHDPCAALAAYLVAELQKMR